MLNIVLETADGEFVNDHRISVTTMPCSTKMHHVQ